VFLINFLYFLVNQGETPNISQSGSQGFKPDRIAPSSSDYDLLRIQPIVVKDIDLGEKISIVSSKAFVEEPRVTCSPGTVPIIATKPQDKNITSCGNMHETVYDSNVLKFLYCFKVSCPSGTYYDNRSTSCQFCAQGYYQPNSGQSECIQCPNGTSTKDHLGGAKVMKQCKG